MADERQKQEIEAKLARYEALGRQFSDGPTFENIRKEVEKLQQQLRKLDK